jgi:DNA-binding transcriptional LysR family regulator
MKTDHLPEIRTLVQIIDCGTLTEAGRRLGLTPSAVSRQVSRLENVLGVRLLERTTRRVRPTDAGLELRRRVAPALEAVTEAMTVVRERDHEPRGRVRLSASRAFGQVRLLPILAGVGARHPGLTFDVVLTGRRVDLIEEEIDLAVREGPLRDSSLVARSLGSYRIVACAAPAYLAGRGPIRRLEDLAHHDVLAVPPSGPASDLARLRGRDGRRLRLTPRFVVDDLLSLRDLAVAGGGVALLPDFVAAPAVADGNLTRLLPRAIIGELPIAVVHPSHRHVPRRVRVVLDALAADLR